MSLKPAITQIDRRLTVVEHNYMSKEEHANWLTAIHERFNQQDQRFEAEQALNQKRYCDMMTALDAVRRDVRIIREDHTATHARMDRISERMDRIDERFDSMDVRMDHMDEKIDRMEKRMDRMDKRFDMMDERMDRMDVKIDRIDQRMDSMEQKMDLILEKIG